MPIFKCKMCGGDLNILDGATVCECEYCGSRQTLPKLDDEKRVALFERANYFRRNNEFDKAMGIYEMILSEDNEDAEAYWSVALCQYGIEYVEDPKNHKRVPTVNRTNSKSILKDGNYLKAIQYADGYQKDIFESEAKNIDSIQKNILAISSKEEPYDVFICYKETDFSGKRTYDSVYAQDIYDALTKEGFRTFFSRVTLEDKIGTAYEPYIYSALNSAKVMLVVGTSAENMNSPWVKNEWSRFLSIVKENSQKAIVPCYKEMSPYDMPEEFTYLQAQDIGKIGFMQDLINGVKKIISNGVINAKNELIIAETQSSKAKPLLERAYIFLSDNEWKKANQYSEKVLDIEPRNARAYMCKYLASIEIPSFEALKDITINQHFVFDLNTDFFNAEEFADGDFSNEIENFIKERIEARYCNACDMMNNHNYKNAKLLFDEIRTYKDSQVKANECSQNMSTINSKLNDINRCNLNIDLLQSEFDKCEESKINTYEQINDCDRQLEIAPWIIKKSKNMLIVALVLWVIGALAFISFASRTETGYIFCTIFVIQYFIMYIVFNVFWSSYLKKVIIIEPSKERKNMISCGILLVPFGNALSLVYAGRIIDESKIEINSAKEAKVILNKKINDINLTQREINEKLAQNRSIISDAREIVSQLSKKENNYDKFPIEHQLLCEVGDMVLETGKVSTSFIQRKLGVGYLKASGILEQLENLGVISKSNGVNPRKTLISESDWSDLKLKLIVGDMA